MTKAASDAATVVPVGGKNVANHRQEEPEISTDSQILGVDGWLVLAIES